MDVLAPKLAAMKRERSELADSLAATQSTPQPKNVEGIVKMAMDRLTELAAEFKTADQTKLQELIRRMVSRVELWFEPNPERKGTIRCCRGSIELREDPVAFLLAQGKSLFSSPWHRIVVPGLPLWIHQAAKEKHGLRSIVSNEE